MRTFYLAGPMTGIPQFNFPAFYAAASALRDEYDMNIISPAELDDPVTIAAALASPDGAPGSGSTNGETWGDFLSRDVKLIADKVGGIVLMPDWADSRGARLEAFVGILCGHEFYFINKHNRRFVMTRHDVMRAIDFHTRWNWRKEEASK